MTDMFLHFQKGSFAFRMGGKWFGFILVKVG